RVLRNLVFLAGEKLFLVIEARPPRQITADLQVLAQAVTHHIQRVNAFGGIGVVGATGGVDVVVAGPPAQLRRVDPTLDLKGNGLGRLAYRDRLFFQDGF